MLVLVRPSRRSPAPFVAFRFVLLVAALLPNTLSAIAPRPAPAQEVAAQEVAAQEVASETPGGAEGDDRRSETDGPEALALEPGKPLSLFDGRSLAPWRSIDVTVYKRHGEVAIVDGAIRMSAGMPATGIVLDRRPPEIDYELRFEARRIDGSDIFCGLTFPIDTSHCTLVLGGWGGGVTGLSNVDDFSAIENLTTEFQEFENGTWYPVRLRVTRHRIRAWVGERKLVDIATGEHRYEVWWEQEPARPLGITTWNTTAEVRGIEIERLDEATVAAEGPAEKDPLPQDDEADDGEAAASDADRHRE